MDTSTSSTNQGPTTPARRSIWPVLLGGIISVAALGLLYWLVDIQSLYDTLRSARLGYLLIGLLIVYPLAMIFRGQRWWWLLAKTLPWTDSLHIINIGYMANMIFPARLGEVVRLLLVRNQPNGDSGRAISAVAVERLVDLLFALLCVALGLALLGDASSLPPQVVNSLSIFITITVLGFGVLFFTPPLHPYIVKFASGLLRRFIPSLEVRITGLIDRTLTSMKSLASPGRLLLIIGWSAITWAGYAAFYYLVLLAFTDDISLGVSILATGFIALSIGIPSVPSYAGPFHVGAALSLSLYGYSEALGASFALTAHALVTLLTIAVGVYSMQALQTNLRSLRQLVRLGGESSSATPQA